MSEKDKIEESNNCCGPKKCCVSNCCSGTQVAKLLRHVAEFFDKKKD